METKTKFEVGDKVKVREFEEIEKGFQSRPFGPSPVFTSKMRKLCGGIFSVSKTSHLAMSGNSRDVYFLEGIDEESMFSDFMLEPIHEKTLSTTYMSPKTMSTVRIWSEDDAITKIVVLDEIIDYAELKAAIERFEKIIKMNKETASTLPEQYSLMAVYPKGGVDSLEGSKKFGETSVEKGQKLWDYLTKKLDMLDDNNFTARQIFDYVSKRSSKHAYDEYEIPLSDLKRMVEKAETEGKSFVRWRDYRLKSLKI